MKEHDVRQRIESFLKRTAREVVIPASVGLGLVLAGCREPDAVVLYRAPDPDVGTDADVPVAIVPYHPNAPVDTGAGVGVDAGASEAGMDAAVPDAAADAVTPDADVDEGMTDGETD
jgi:hypothetical protein